MEKYFTSITKEWPNQEHQELWHKYFCWGELLDIQNFTDEAIMASFPHFHTNLITFLYSVQLQVSSA